ncbi:hypothetical protein [Cohnella sp. AR92]|uniref:hypothetical protein n=1 Tax=Cohnella sp. AR92 TaxID=648716 RepID=UPI000F8DD696|nr:hypothetical protein [Cohnella sp. AR92]RUS47267.1 hypothetical protein ELR57_09050 [Cohnella sp. AR92]
MDALHRQAADDWINDHLDLYNHALQIGDSAWQEQILDTLNQKEEAIRLLVNVLILQKLWDRFDAINRLMLSLYDLAREDESPAGQKQLYRAVRELGKQRAAVTSQIRSLTSSPPLE